MYVYCALRNLILIIIGDQKAKVVKNSFFTNRAFPETFLRKRQTVLIEKVCTEETVFMKPAVSKKAWYLVWNGKLREGVKKTRLFRGNFPLALYINISLEPVLRLGESTKKIFLIKKVDFFYDLP